MKLEREPSWHDCEANAGKLLGENKKKHRLIAAESQNMHTTIVFIHTF